jgi:hypothetical protein
VLDDVWSPEQLAAFPVAGQCARLVTTRNPSLAAGSVVPVQVDQMSDRQARALLESGLPPLPTAVAQRLAEELGRWPLPLRLANKILADQARLQADIAKTGEELLARLQQGGTLEVDQLTGEAARELDVSDHQRVDVDDRAELLQRPVLPLPHRVQRLVGHPRDSVVRQVHARRLPHVPGDVPHGHALRVKTGHHGIEPFGPACLLRDQHRVERPDPVPRHRYPHRPHLGIQRLGARAVAPVPVALAVQVRVELGG